MNEHHELFLRALRRHVPDLLVTWHGEEAVERDLQAALQVELDRCHSRAFAEGFAAACPVDGCTATDYLQRILEAGPGQKLLVGIRFHGLLGFPFVDLLASTAPLDDADGLRTALDAIRADYAPFAPQAVRLLRGAHEPLSLPRGVEASLDQHIVIGHVNSLSARPAPHHIERVAVRTVDDLEEATAEVAAAYAALFEENPALDGVLFPAALDDLMRARETGALVWIEIDGRRAGLLATAETAGPLVHGQVVVEQILWAEFRGRGLAAAAQRRLVDHLARRDPDTLIHGTIDARNHASLATARRVGRVEVAAWHWLRWDTEASTGASEAF